MENTHIKLEPLYKVSLISNKNQHFYTIGDDEKWLPGVTTVLNVIAKPALVQWASNTACQNIKEYLMANAIDKPLTKEEIEKACLEGKNIYKSKSAEAADVGSRVHSTIDAIIKGIPFEITPDIKPAVDGFLAWKESQHIEIIGGDTRLGSKLFGFGGSLDFIGLDGDQIVIFDNKTTKKRKDRDHGIYPEFAAQLSAYSVAFRETYGLNVKAVYALWLDKESVGFKALKVSDINRGFETFLACLKLYQSQKFEMFDE